VDAKILIVDADTTLLYDLTVQLRDAEYRVIIAATSQHALSQLAVNDVDLVLLDSGIASLSQTSLAVLMKELYPNLIVLLSSGDPTIAWCLPAGVDGFIQKPVSPPVLLAKISAVLKRTP
jgi:DNA-binding response OmpR family regulator